MNDLRKVLETTRHRIDKGHRENPLTLAMLERRQKLLEAELAHLIHYTTKED